MKLHKFMTLLLIAVVIFMLPLQAQNKDAKKQESKFVSVEFANEPAVIIGGAKISLADAIRKAIEQNHDIISGSYDVAMADTELESFKKKYAVFFNAEAGVSYSEYPDTVVASYGNKAKQYDFSGSLSKSFSTGTTVSTGLQHTYMNITSNSSPGYQGGIPVYYTPVLFVSIQQELLKNSLGYNDFKWLSIKKNNAKIQREVVLQNLSIVVLGVIADYWNLIARKTELENSQLQYAETIKVRGIIRRNVKIGLADNYQLNFYNNLVANAETTKLQAEHYYKVALRNFLTTINMNDEIEIGNRVILSNKEMNINVDDALNTAYEKRADYMAAQLTLKNARMELGIYSNEELPSLTAEFTANYFAFDRSLSTAYGDTTTMEYPSYEVRLKMSYPLNDTAQKVSRRNASYKLKQAQVELDKVSRVVKDDIRNKVEQITTRYKIYEKTKIARIQSWIYYRRMRANLFRGRLSAQEVKGGLDTWIMSKQNEINALIAYNIALLEFEVAKNELFEKFKIDVDQYIPKDQ